MLSLLFVLACSNSSDVVEEPTCVSESWQDAAVPAAVQAAFEAELSETNASGVAFAILQDGEIRFAGSVGDRDAGNALPMEPDTLLRNGSNLKMQTAAAVLGLAAQGDLTLMDTLDVHLPDFSMAAQPGVAESATVHDLLSHQGGFYDYTPIDGPSGPNSLYGHAHNVFAQEYFMMAPPGNFWNYSNPNFSLAGLVAQEASGRPYAEVMKDDVWTPLCMDRTYLTAEEVFEDARYAIGRQFNGVGFDRVEPDAYDHGFAKPAGFGWTTTMDMLRFADFLMAGHAELAPNGENLLLTDAQVDTAIYREGVLQYGYGVFRWERYNAGDDQWKQALLWEHGGDIPGFASDLWVLPEHDLAIAVLANGDGAHFQNSLLATVEHFVDLEDAPAPDDAFDLALLDQIEGSYEDAWNVGRLEFTRNGDVLQVVAPRLDDLQIPYSSTLTPLDATRLRWDVQGETIAIDFVAGPEGPVQFLRHRAFVAERTTDASPMSLVPEASVQAWLEELEDVKASSNFKGVF